MKALLLLVAFGCLLHLTAGLFDDLLLLMAINSMQQQQQQYQYQQPPVYSQPVGPSAGWQQADPHRYPGGQVRDARWYDNNT